MSSPAIAVSILALDGFSAVFEQLVKAYKESMGTVEEINNEFIKNQERLAEEVKNSKGLLEGLWDEAEKFIGAIGIGGTVALAATALGASTLTAAVLGTVAAFLTLSDVLKHFDPLVEQFIEAWRDLDPGLGTGLADFFQSNERWLITLGNQLDDLQTRYRDLTKEPTETGFEKLLEDIDKFKNELRASAVLIKSEIRNNPALQFLNQEGLQNLFRMDPALQQIQTLIKFLDNLRDHIEEDLGGAFGTAEEKVGQLGQTFNTTLEKLPECSVKWENEFSKGFLVLDSEEMWNAFVLFLQGSEAEFREWVRRNQEAAREILNFDVEVPHGMKDIIQHELSLQKSGDAAAESQRNLNSAVSSGPGPFFNLAQMVLSAAQAQSDLATNTKSAGTAMVNTANSSSKVVMPFLKDSNEEILKQIWALPQLGAAAGGAGAALGQMGQDAKDAADAAAKAGQKAFAQDMVKFVGAFNDEFKTVFGPEATGIINDFVGLFQKAEGDLTEMWDDHWAGVIGLALNALGQMGGEVGNALKIVGNSFVQFQGVLDQVGGNLELAWEKHWDQIVNIGLNALRQLTGGTNDAVNAITGAISGAMQRSRSTSMCPASPSHLTIHTSNFSSPVWYNRYEELPIAA